MARTFCLVSIFLYALISARGQCPTVELSRANGSVCGLIPTTITGTFGGSALWVTISTNGKGSVSPRIATSSPFSFTYTPKKGDLGEDVEIKITTNDPFGRQCKAARLTYSLSVTEAPEVPRIGTITQPSCTNPTGSVVLNGLPTKGTWVLTQNQSGTVITGNGSSTTVSGLTSGRYNFTVTNSGGCNSSFSQDVNINSAPDIPTLLITNPDPVCFPSTVDLTAGSITAGTGSGITYSYWRNSRASQVYSTPTAASDGTYFIKGTLASSGCSDIKPVTVIVRQKPVAYAGSDIVLDYLFETKLAAAGPGPEESGKWSILSGAGTFSDSVDAQTRITNLSLGKNIFLWTLSNGVCQPSYDSVTVTVLKLIIPTLITPNMDGRNDYLIAGRSEIDKNTELVIFDRRGSEVYRTMTYDNKWNGIDNNGNPLPDDTYFYSLKFQDGRSISGYIVIRR
jgi:gliding motility-associated-like protein